MRRGREIAICNGWSKIEPPIFFSLAREKKTGRSRSKRKERLKGAVQDFGWYFYKREVQIDLTLRRTPLPLLRRAEWLVPFSNSSVIKDRRIHNARLAKDIEQRPLES